MKFDKYRQSFLAAFLWQPTLPLRLLVEEFIKDRKDIALAMAQGSVCGHLSIVRNFDINMQSHVAAYIPHIQPTDSSSLFHLSLSLRELNHSTQTSITRAFYLRAMLQSPPKDYRLHFQSSAPVYCAQSWAQFKLLISLGFPPRGRRAQQMKKWKDMCAVRWFENVTDTHLATRIWPPAHFAHYELCDRL